MKKIIIIVFVFLFISRLYFVAAISKSTTPSPASTSNVAAANAASPTIGDTQNQIDNLKDRIASRVAKLNLVEKRGVIGKVTDASETQITLSDTDGNIKYIDVDEITKFTSPSSKGNFGILDITKGATIGVLGLYNKESRRILGRFVDVLNLHVNISGGISDIDKPNFNAYMITPTGDTILIDVEAPTKTYVYTPGTGLTRVGFSKITKGERVTVIGFIDAKDNKKLVASRIILFPSLPMNPKITLPLSPTSIPSPSATIAPTTSTKKSSY